MELTETGENRPESVSNLTGRGLPTRPLLERKMMKNQGVHYLVRIETNHTPLWVVLEQGQHPKSGQWTIQAQRGTPVRAEWIGYAIEYAVAQGCYGNIFIDKVEGF